MNSPNQTLSPQGIVLLAHGARDPAWARPFEAVAREVSRQQPGVSVSLGFLEFMAPTIAEAASQLAQQGCRRVDLVPLFLGAGGHVRKDVPDIVAQLAKAYPDVAFELHPAIGESPLVIQAMATAALQASSPSTAPTPAVPRTRP